MATVNQNAVVYGAISAQGFKSVHVPVTHSTNPVKQGELLYLDASAHIAKPLDSDAHAATLLGVALQPSAVSGSIDASSEKSVMVAWDVVAQFKTTATEVFYPGLAVYIGADAQTVTATAGSNKIGAVVLPIGVASVTGAAGVNVQVLVKSAAY
jgi:hypothetical protein